MAGWQLRLWRWGLLWSRDRAAEELGVSLRTYKDYENAERMKRAIALATVTLTLSNMLPALQSEHVSKAHLVDLLQKMTADATGK
jgi:hypothetical protein